MNINTIKISKKEANRTIKLKNLSGQQVGFRPIWPHAPAFMVRTPRPETLSVFAPPGACANWTRTKFIKLEITYCDLKEKIGDPDGI